MNADHLERPHVVFHPGTWAVAVLFWAALIAGIITAANL